MEMIPITREGLQRLKEELSNLEKSERPRNISAIEEARAHGDLSENAEYHAAKEKQSFIEGRINELKTVIGQSEVIDPDQSPCDVVVFGRKVLIYNQDADEEVEYRLVGPYESDPEKGMISIMSPLGKALIGKAEGDEVQVSTPGGVQEYEVVRIS